MDNQKISIGLFIKDGSFADRDLKIKNRSGRLPM